MIYEHRTNLSLLHYNRRFFRCGSVDFKHRRSKVIRFGAIYLLWRHFIISDILYFWRCFNGGLWICSVPSNHLGRTFQQCIDGFVSLDNDKATPAAGWPFQEQFATALGLVPRTVIASIIAYWAGEIANSFTLAKIKVRMEGKKLWIRTISSTIVGQGVDTIFFVLIGFWGVIPTNVLITAIWSGYLFKVLYEAIATPMTYAIVGWLKRVEGVDYYDRDTDFNPLIISS